MLPPCVVELIDSVECDAISVVFLLVVIWLLELDLVTDVEPRLRLFGSNGGGPICCSCWIIVRSIAARGLKSSMLSMALVG